MDNTPHASRENTPGDKQEERTGEPNKPFWYSVLSFLRFIAIVFVIVIPIRMYIAQPFIVRGESMHPTFENSDYLIIDEFTYRFVREAERGEVIIFRYPRDPSTFFIKRVIGVPGDTVVITSGSVFITHEGQIFSDPLADFIEPVGPDGTWQLGEDEYFVMGDNRDFSSDSRVWGVLPEDLIIGRAFLRLWPVSELDILPGK